MRAVVVGLKQIPIVGGTIDWIEDCIDIAHELEIEKAIKLDLNYAAFFYNRRLAYQALGNIGYAEQDFLKAEQLRSQQK